MGLVWGGRLVGRAGKLPKFKFPTTDGQKVEQLPPPAKFKNKICVSFWKMSEIWALRTILPSESWSYICKRISLNGIFWRRHPLPLWSSCIFMRCQETLDSYHHCRDAGIVIIFLREPMIKLSKVWKLFSKLFPSGVWYIDKVLLGMMENMQNWLNFKTKIYRLNSDLRIACLYIYFHTIFQDIIGNILKVGCFLVWRSH